jgi:predicted DNA-binding transcriptional regulator YafY
MRADRLVATLLVLQSRGRVTAAELAEELEISVKTARRDLEALAIAGIPVYPQRGKGGGWSLLGGARTDLSGLTADEARTLFLVAGPSSTATPNAKAALRKLVRALPETFRAGAEAAAAAVVLDPAGWGGTSRARPRHLDALQRAVVDGVQVRLGYADRARSESERVVHPLGLVEKDSIWYLVAGTDHGMRTFRVSRVRAVAATGEPVVRPDGFDLATTWDAVVATIEDRRTALRAVVRGPAWCSHALRAQFGPSTTLRAELADGRVEVEVGGQSASSIAERLAGWGPHDLEVLDPPEVRGELARIGRSLLERYGAEQRGPVMTDVTGGRSSEPETVSE